MSFEFRKPNLGDIEEITSFKKEFADNNSGMDGTGILVKSSAEERKCLIPNGFVESIVYGVCYG